MPLTLILFAVLSGSVSLAVLWPHGLMLSLIGAPFIASAMTALGAILMKSDKLPQAFVAERSTSSMSDSRDLGLND